MNVIFLDFEGTIITHHGSKEDIEKKVKILSEICKGLDCKVVIESVYKESIDEETMETISDFVKYVFALFNKYGIKCVGRTPSVDRNITDYFVLPNWKEDEIRLYLFRHPEVEHYCVLDDDDRGPNNSDLKKVKDHLVRMVYYSHNADEEGLLESHKEEIGEILKKENEVRVLALKRKL